MDVVASLYGRNNLTYIVEETIKDVFVPLTVGGGIRSAEDAKRILRSGADKVAVNTAAVLRPSLISEIAESFGSQCMVLSVEAKQNSAKNWEVCTDNGRERTGLDVIEWIQHGISLGAGEILITSIDNEGTRKGFDCDLIRAVSTVSHVPIIASGGMGKPEDMVDAVKKGGADAVAMADILHYGRATVNEIRDFAKNSEINVRAFPYV